jgi:hypothetical protein
MAGAPKEVQVVDTFRTAAEASCRAMNLLHAYRLKNPGRPLVVVFDIDETILRNVRRDEYFHINPAVFTLHEMAAGIGAKCYLVTARPDAPENRAWTEAQLRAMGTARYERLYLCPDAERDTPVTVSGFKARCREEIARENGACVTLTVGDQWSDLFRLRTEADLRKHTRLVKSAPYSIVRPNDGISVWGLKLKEFD